MDSQSVIHVAARNIKKATRAATPADQGVSKQQDVYRAEKEKHLGKVLQPQRNRLCTTQSPIRF